MVTPVKNTSDMIAQMAPIRHAQAYVFCTVKDAQAYLDHAFALIREDEGLTLILPLEVAEPAGFDCALPMARITLQVQSALDGLGLTAAVATALSQAGIPCNMVAAYHHDHVFVPQAQAAAALTILSARARQA